MEDFNDFCGLMELFDVLLVGRNFTWYRNGSSTKSRLNKFLLVFSLNNCACSCLDFLSLSVQFALLSYLWVKFDC